MPSQEEIWDDLVGDAWARNDAVIEAHGRAFGEAAMDRLGRLDGKAALDVGCGTGGTTLELARRGARPVVGVDLSERMLAVAARREVAGVSFLRSDVMAVEGQFDVVFSRFGIMFFDDAVAGFRHLRSLTAADGRLAFACWRDPMSNPWMSLAVMAAIPVLGPPRLPEPEAPGPFSLADPARIHQVLGDAGWVDVDVDELTLEQPHPAGSADAVAALIVAQAPPLAMPLAERPDLAGDVVGLVAEAFRPLERNGTVVVAGSVNVVSATAGTAP